jgi:ribose transport system permease protein
LLPAFAAVFLGSTQLKPGRANTWGTLLAVFVLATGVQGLQFVTGVLWLNSMFNGVALIAAVSFAVWRQGRPTRSHSADLADAQHQARANDDEREPITATAASAHHTLPG